MHLMHEPPPPSPPDRLLRRHSKASLPRGFPRRPSHKLRLHVTSVPWPSHPLSEPVFAALMVVSAGKGRGALLYSSRCDRPCSESGHCFVLRPPGGWGVRVRDPKKVCVPKIGLKLCLRKSYLMWEAGAGQGPKQEGQKTQKGHEAMP